MTGPLHPFRDRHLFSWLYLNTATMTAGFWRRKLNEGPSFVERETSVLCEAALVLGLSSGGVQAVPPSARLVAV
jgi:hypothetical protein